MSPRINHHFWIPIFIFSSLISSGRFVSGDIDRDKQVLLSLKSYIQHQNPEYDKDHFSQWKSEHKSPCKWPGISCDTTENFITGIDLSDKNIMGILFNNFSSLPELRYLNLSDNMIEGEIPDDIGKCKNLISLNVSNNIINEFYLTRFDNLQILDMSNNRIQGYISNMFPPAEVCRKLMVLNLSVNSLFGSVDGLFSSCRNLQFLDLRGNGLNGDIFFRFDGLIELSVHSNDLSGSIPSWVFGENCSLKALNLAYNSLVGSIPIEISNCKNLEILNLSGNKFSGKIPAEIGSLSRLKSLVLSSNRFSRDIPMSLVEMNSLLLLELSSNGFGGNVQEVFGRFNQVKYLFWSGNSYTGGLISSGIHKLRNLSELHLSDNDFLNPLPLEFSQMSSLKMLVLANNSFTGNIPSEFGNLSSLQVLDLSYNKLSGSIPQTFGKLSSIMWLNLENNSLTGEIPAELGNCSSLLWLNLAKNRLSGTISPEIFDIGNNPMQQFLLNRMDNNAPGLDRCTTLQKWVPSDDFPLSFFPRGECDENWDSLFNGYDFFALCTSSSNEARPAYGYIQLSGNNLYGEIPSEIRNLRNFMMLYLDDNGFTGLLLPEIGLLPLIVLNISRNGFSGDIPNEIGTLTCLKHLDMSYNNFSGEILRNFNDLSMLSRFNISYNPFVYGRIPSYGILATFDRSSFLGNPLLELGNGRKGTSVSVPRKDDDGKLDGLLDGFLISFVVFYPIFFVLSFLGILFWGNEQLSVLKMKKK